MLILLSALAAASPVAEPPAVVVFGGGWAPEGNQASIERDVARLMVTLRSSSPRLLFADGDHRRRTVQISSPADPLSTRLGLVFGRPDALQVGYRPTRLRPDQPATAEAVAAVLADITGDAAGGVAFGAGHGTPATETTPAALATWGGSLDVPALARALDEARAKGPLTLVLGQCHSGAFMDLAHRGGNPRAPLAVPARCVLAAVPRELEAAGCSPDAEDPKSNAFLRSMSIALAGPGDFDRDRRVQLDEALAFARIHDGTVDVPVRSSELWLERRVGDVGLGGVARPMLVQAADSGERAVLEGIEPDRTPEAIERSFDRLVGEARALEPRLEALDAELEEARGVALAQLLDVYPELANPYHPRARALLSGGAAEVQKIWREAPGPLEALEAARRRLDRVEESRWTLETRIARLDRWLRTARAVIRRRRLAKSDRADYERLRACERVGFSYDGAEAREDPRAPR